MKLRQIPGKPSACRKGQNLDCSSATSFRFASLPFASIRSPLPCFANGAPVVEPRCERFFSYRRSDGDVFSGGVLFFSSPKKGRRREGEDTLGKKLKLV